MTTTEEAAEVPWTEKVRPLGARLCVVARTADEKIGSLYIPTAAQETEQIGTVVAVGADVRTLAVGAVVLFGKFSGSPVEVDGVELLVLQEDDVLLEVL